MATKIKILLVDDSSDYAECFIKFIQEELPDMVDSVIVVKNGLEAINLVNHNKFDLIFMDINMPGMNGFDATRYLNIHFPSITVVALSFMSDLTSMERMIAAGARYYVVKEEFDADTLMRIIKDK